jgi:hypothetical protein
VKHLGPDFRPAQRECFRKAGYVEERDRLKLAAIQYQNDLAWDGVLCIRDSPAKNYHWFKKRDYLQRQVLHSRMEDVPEPLPDGDPGLSEFDVWRRLCREGAREIAALVPSAWMRAVGEAVQMVSFCGAFGRCKGRASA